MPIIRFLDFPTSQAWPGGDLEIDCSNMLIKHLYRILRLIHPFGYLVLFSMKYDHVTYDTYMHNLLEWIMKV